MVYLLELYLRYLFPMHDAWGAPHVQYINLSQFYIYQKHIFNKNEAFKVENVKICYMQLFMYSFINAGGIYFV